MSPTWRGKKRVPAACEKWQYARKVTVRQRVKCRSAGTAYRSACPLRALVTGPNRSKAPVASRGAGAREGQGATIAPDFYFLFF